MTRWLGWALTGLLGVVTWRHTATLASIIAEAERYPAWDMAKRGLDAVALAAALQQFDVVAFGARILDMKVWPPLVPLLHTPWVLVFGADYDVPRWATLVWLPILVGMAWWCGWRLTRSIYGGVLAGGLMLASPQAHLLAMQIMTEVPGAALLLSAFACMAWALETDDERAWSAAALTSLAVFFTKYNYGVLWVGPVGFYLALRQTGGWAGLVSTIGKLVRSVEWFRPWTLFLVAYGAGMVWLIAGPGLDVDVFGHRLRATTAAGPLYGLLVVALIRWWMRHTRPLTVLGRRLERIDPGPRRWLVWVGAPIAAWLVIPSHWRAFVSFLSNRRDGPSGFAGLGYYPEVIVTSYSVDTWIGWLVLGLGVSAVVWLIRPLDGRPSVGLLLITVVIGGLALAAHPYKLPRFAFTWWPFLVLAAVWHGQFWLERLRGRRETAFVLGGLAALLVVMIGLEGVDRPRRTAELVARSTSIDARPLLDAIAMESTDASVVLLGSRNLFSPALVSWHLARHRATASPIDATTSQADTDTNRVLTPCAGRSGCTRDELVSELDRLVASSGGRLLWLTVDSDDPNSVQGDETAWLARFEPLIVERYGLQPSSELVAAGYRLRIY
ncbi:MAG: hypothetical protein AAGD38_13125 [Acidobacteriota bacterium]